MAANEVQRRLHAELDKRGWKPPWHHHFRTVVNSGRYKDPTKPPIYIINCRAIECEATGCPRTESGFPGETIESLRDPKNDPHLKG